MSHASRCARAAERLESERAREQWESSDTYLAREAVYMRTGLSPYMRDMVARGFGFRPVWDAEEWPILFDGGLVAVGLSPLFTGRGLKDAAGWRVYVCDADDTSLYLDFDARDDALRMYRSIPLLVSRDDLRARGMRY